MRKLYAANPAKFIERSRAAYAANPGKHQRVSNRWKWANCDHVKEYSKQYRAKHLPEVIARLADWRAANPDAGRRHAQTGRNRLSDSYVAKALVARRADVSLALIELKREQLLTYRVFKGLVKAINEVQKENQNGIANQ